MKRIQHVHTRRRNGSSVRSDMFVARHAVVCPKLRRREYVAPPGLGIIFGGRFQRCRPYGLAHRPPGEILKALGQLEAEIQQGMKELEGMLK